MSYQSGVERLALKRVHLDTLRKQRPEVVSRWHSFVAKSHKLIEKAEALKDEPMNMERFMLLADQHFGPMSEKDRQMVRDEVQAFLH